MAYISFQPSDYFDTKLYTQSGSNNNGNTQTLTMDNVGWVWIKNRDFTNGHCLFDIVRGGDKLLATNGTAAAETAGGGITFGSSDTTIGADTGGYGFNNRVGDDYVAWHWRASGTSGSSNTDGSITSTVSANDTAGFSIVKYTGTGSAGNVGHGLSTAPKVLINKALGTQDWFVGHSSIGFTKFLKLNATNAESTNSGIWNDTAPTTDHFTINSANGNTNGTGVEYITYCFAEKKGFSKFGSYLGTSSADGPFVYTGFTPAFVLIKGVSTTDWNLYDSKRLGYNGGDAPLFANLSNAESSDYGRIDFLSNGFKIRTTNAQVNNNNTVQIYMAFAESPLVSSNGLPAVAR